MIDGITSRLTVLNIGTDKTENIKGLRLKPICEDFYSVRGSLHKYINDGLHNANDFYLSDLKNTLNMLSDEIGLNADICPLNGFEFGVNIKLSINPNNALKRLILHKSNQGNNSKDYKEFDYKNHSFKFYNKSGLTKIEPYNSENILRIEVKVSKMPYIRKKGIYLKLLSDLLDVSVWERLEKILINTINECLFIDFSENEVKQLSQNNLIKYLEFCNPLYWEKLYNDTRKNRNKYCRERLKCEEFISKFSKSTLKTDIINLISYKCKELRDTSKTNDIIKKWDKITIIQSSTKPDECNKITYKINCNYVPEELNTITYCKSCGKSILNPRKGQMYCSSKIVGYNQAHKCRNNNSNPRNNTLRSIKKVLSIPLMFELSETIAPEKKMYLR
jgi:hypothetical protein